MSSRSIIGRRFQEKERLKKSIQLGLETGTLTDPRVLAILRDTPEVKTKLARQAEVRRTSAQRLRCGKDPVKAKLAAEKAQVTQRLNKLKHEPLPDFGVRPDMSVPETDEESET